ncbi:MAG: hypothetical protein J6P75_02915 [Bacteroidales bacterium]|nr:hypothetical protein [Bacteroidales bacterium]
MKLKHFILLASAALLAGCAKNELPLFDEPFVYLETATGSDSAVVGADMKATITYYIAISCPAFTDPIGVNYTVTCGSGLTEGVDYDVLTQGGTVSFLPGIWRMPVRIQWKDHAIDESKDNTVTIALTGTSTGTFTLGYPGPAAKGSKLVITKKNL